MGNDSAGNADSTPGEKSKSSGVSSERIKESKGILMKSSIASIEMGELSTEASPIDWREGEEIRSNYNGGSQNTIPISTMSINSTGKQDDGGASDTDDKILAHYAAGYQTGNNAGYMDV